MKLSKKDILGLRGILLYFMVEKQILISENTKIDKNFYDEHIETLEKIIKKLEKSA